MGFVGHIPENQHDNEPKEYYNGTLQSKNGPPSLACGLDISLESSFRTP